MITYLPLGADAGPEGAVRDYALLIDGWRCGRLRYGTATVWLECNYGRRLFVRQCDAEDWLMSEHHRRGR